MSRSLPRWVGGLGVFQTDWGTELGRSTDTDRVALVQKISQCHRIDCDLAKIGVGRRFATRRRLPRLVRSLAKEAGTPLLLLCDPPSEVLAAALSDSRNADLWARASRRGVRVAPVSESPIGWYHTSHSLWTSRPRRLHVFLAYSYEVRRFGDNLGWLADSLVSQHLAHELLHWFPEAAGPISDEMKRALASGVAHDPTATRFPTDPVARTSALRALCLDLEVDRRTRLLGHSADLEFYRRLTAAELEALRGGFRRPATWDDMLRRLFLLPPDSAEEWMGEFAAVIGEPSPAARLAAARPVDKPWTLAEVESFEALPSA